MVAATGSGNTRPGSPRGGRGGDGGRASRSCWRRAAPPGRSARPTRSRAAARRGSGPARSRQAICARSRRAWRWRSALAPASTATGWRRSSPTRYPDRPMPLDTLITGRIATLAGPDGFGWVEADRHPRWADRLRRLRGGPRDPGRSVHAADPPGARPGRDPRADRCAPPPRPGRARQPPGGPDRRRDARGWAGASSTRPTGHRATPGRGWRVMAGTATAGAAGRPPTTSSGSRPVAGWPSGPTTITPCGRATRHRARSGSGSADPPGGVVRRAPDGSPEGVLFESATRLVTIHVPPPTPDDLAAAIEDVGRRARRARRRGLPRPGRRRARSRPRRTRTRSMPGSPTPATCRSGSMPACATTASRRPSSAAFAAGPSSATIPTGWARVGWQKCFADGSLGSRTAALLEDIEHEPDRPLAPERRRGVWMTDRDGLAERVARAAAGGHHDPDPRHRRCGRAGRAGRPDARGRQPAAHAPDRARPDAPPGRPRPVRRGRHRGVACSRSTSGRTRRRPAGCGAPAPRREAYTWRSIAETGAVMAFGTDAPVESFDPWPGLALAVRREDRALAGRDAALRARTRRSRSTGRCAANVRRPRASRRARRTVAASRSGSAPTSSSSPPPSIDEPVDARRPARDDPARHSS